jgi:hypothetical protein
VNSRLAAAKVEEVLQIIDPDTDRNSPIFDINDARWCIKILAEAIAAILPEDPD